MIDERSRGLPWPFRRYSRPLTKDRWFVVAALIVTVLMIASVWQRAWLGGVTTLVVFELLGGIRVLRAAFLAGYRGTPGAR